MTCKTPFHKPTLRATTLALYRRGSVVSIDMGLAVRMCVLWRKEVSSKVLCRSSRREAQSQNVIRLTVCFSTDVSTLNYICHFLVQMKSTKVQTFMTPMMYARILATSRGVAVLRGPFSLLRDIRILRSGSATRSLYDETASQLCRVSRTREYKDINTHAQH